MSDWEDFKTKCPSCDNTKICDWIHSNDSYHEKINKDGDIKCNNSSCYYYDHPTFIMEWKFECGNHGDYWKPNGNNVWAALSMISSICNLSKPEKKNYLIELMNMIKYYLLYKLIFYL